MPANRMESYTELAQVKISVMVDSLLFLLAGAVPSSCAQYARAGNLARAESCYTQALQRRPDPATLSEAINIYRRAIAAHGATPDRVYNLALALYHADQYGESLRILAGQPSDTPEWHALAGACARELGDTARSLQELQAAAAAAPDNVDYRYDYAIALLRSGASSDAEAELNKAIARFPKSAKLHAALGMAAYGNGRNAEAVRHYEKAVALEPGAADLHASLGDICYATGDHEKAARSYAAATRLEPRDSAWHDKEGRNFLRLLRTADAVKSFRKALLCDPEDLQAHFQLGKLAAAEGQDASAITHLEKVSRNGEAPPEVFYQLSRVYRRVGRPADAAGALRQFELKKASMKDIEEQ